MTWGTFTWCAETSASVNVLNGLLSNIKLKVLTVKQDKARPKNNGLTKNKK